MADIVFSSEKSSKTWCIRDIVNQIGPVLKRFIIFIHAWLGCDTTSAIFEHGKTRLIKKLMSCKILQTLAAQMINVDATVQEIVEAGRKIFLIMYGGNSSDSLAKLRYDFVWVFVLIII